MNLTARNIHLREDIYLYYTRTLLIENCEDNIFNLLKIVKEIDLVHSTYFIETNLMLNIFVFCLIKYIYIH